MGQRNFSWLDETTNLTKRNFVIKMTVTVIVSRCLQRKSISLNLLRFFKLVQIFCFVPLEGDTTFLNRMYGHMILYKGLNELRKSINKVN